jgi:four helix bundle suffix protein
MNRYLSRLVPGLVLLAATGGMDEYATIEETFSPEALDAIGDWIVARFPRTQPSRCASANVSSTSRAEPAIRWFRQARSGVQNIAEGSQASGTSKKSELKLTNVARASLEELRLDYEDFLRQRNLPRWPPDHPALVRFKAKRCTTVEEVRIWVEQEHGRARAHTKNPSSLPVREGPCPSVNHSTLVANAALSLLNLCCHLLDRQLEAQAKAFESEGGFTERLYRIRKQKRSRG